MSDKNSNLNRSKKAKNDEFYTLFDDIQNEMNNYMYFDENVFRDKTILLPCDDPSWSNFTKYFALYFEQLGIKKLISTSYAPKSNMSGLFWHPDKSLESFSHYDEEKEYTNGKVWVLEKGVDLNEDDRIDIDDMKLNWSYLEGDGDFRSEEVTKLRDQVDMVITNPPFSLFREFVAWLEEGEVQYSIIGNMNAVTYKEIFPLIKEDKMWLGWGFDGASRFKIPKTNIHLFNPKRYDPETQTVSFGNNKWFTNIEHGRRHEPIRFLNTEDNLRYNKRIIANPNSYQRYDNYDAIEVPVTNGIPSDYEGVMGVPITFLDKYNPEQFEILGSRRWGKSQELLDLYTGDVVPPENDKKTTVNGKETYDRIFIRHLNPEK